MGRSQQAATASIASRLVLSLVVGSLYGVACVLPAIDFQPPERRGFGDITLYGVKLGAVTLLLGWFPPLTIPWSANLFLLAGWVLLLCKKDIAALVFGIVAALAGLSTWAFTSEWLSTTPGQIRLLGGYYLWQASLIAFALGALAIRLWEPRKAPAVVQGGPA